MEALGREFNAVAIGDGVYVNLKDCGGVTFLCFLAGAAGDVYTLVEATSAGGAGAQNLVTIQRYWIGTGLNGQWTRKIQTNNTPLATVTTLAVAGENCCVIEVEQAELSDGYKYVKLTSTGAGLVTPILRDLTVQRSPANLASVVA